MSYSYSQANRLEHPHNYMYTAFQGDALFTSYLSSRMEVVRRCAAAKYESASADHTLVTHAFIELEKMFDSDGDNKFRELLDSCGADILWQSKAKDDGSNDFAGDLEKLDIAAPMPTLDLLRVLIAAQLSNVQNASTKVWLDRLIQRFEVTKKLYESYLPGFRKGKGENTSVRLYGLFALALCLFYVRSNEIKYMSTLLKVCDLLCSLPEDMLQDHISEYVLLGVLATEITSTQALAEKKGISIAIK